MFKFIISIALVLISTFSKAETQKNPISLQDVLHADGHYVTRTDDNLKLRYRVCLVDKSTGSKADNMSYTVSNIDTEYSFVQLSDNLGCLSWNDQIKISSENSIQIFEIKLNSKLLESKSILVGFIVDSSDSSNILIETIIHD